MERIAKSLEQLAEALQALSLALGPSTPEEPVDDYDPDIQQEPPPPTASAVLRHVHARRHHTLRGMPLRGYNRWPTWGTAHVMSCGQKGCRTCARLQKTPMEVVA